MSICVRMMGLIMIFVLSSLHAGPAQNTENVMMKGNSLVQQDIEGNSHQHLRPSQQLSVSSWKKLIKKH